MTASCLVINLERRADRRDRFLRMNGGKAEFRFLAAVEGADLNPEELVADGLLQRNVHAITPGGLGCALSHRQAWLDCVESGRPLIVLEDDAILAPDFASMAGQVTESAPGADILYFGYNLDQPLVVGVAGDLPGLIRVNDSITANPAWLDNYAHDDRTAPRSTTLVRPAVLWGLLAYAVTPAGALKLLRDCFPLRNHDLSLPLGPAQSRGIDGSVLALIQTQVVDAACCFPPIAVGANDDSDTEGVNKRNPAPVGRGEGN